MPPLKVGWTRRGSFRAGPNMQEHKPMWFCLMHVTPNRFVLRASVANATLGQSQANPFTFTQLGAAASRSLNLVRLSRSTCQGL